MSDATAYDVREVLARLPPEKRLFLFLNVSAIHPGNRVFLDRRRSGRDTLASHRAALRYVDAPLARLIERMERRAPLMAILCSDHGTAYGEGGREGYRFAHPVVLEVPYAELAVGRR